MNGLLQCFSFESSSSNVECTIADLLKDIQAAITEIVSANFVMKQNFKHYFIVGRMCYLMQRAKQLNAQSSLFLQLEGFSGSSMKDFKPAVLEKIEREIIDKP